MRVFKLKFHSALHVDARGSGEPEVAEEFIRSDTLSAALCIAWASVFPGIGTDFYTCPPFKVGSAFPYIGDILLFPVPVWPIWGSIDDKNRKKMKKVRWISTSLFEKILKGQMIEISETRILSDIIAVTSEDFKSCPELKNPPFWVITERQRVSVDRLVSKTEGLFFFALEFFGPHSGLWFPTEADAADLVKFRAALDFLSDTGIGADRNSGLGHFTISDEIDFPFENGPKKDGWVTISLFNPNDNENLKKLTEITAYGLTTRSGWISGSTVGRPPIRAFTEGSYFSTRPEGSVVKMLPKSVREQFKLSLEHDSPRDFRAICLPCTLPFGLKEVTS